MTANMSWSYIAGYFDGEGHVSLHPMRGRNTKTVGLFWFNTDWKSLTVMREFMGVGRIATRKRQSGFGGKKQSYVLSVTSKRSLLHALDNMLPFLIIKRDKAEVLRSYLHERVDDGRIANFGKVAAVSTRQLQEWYASGESLGDIARRLGVCHTAVLQAFRVRGLQTRTAAVASSMKLGVPKAPETRQRMKESRRALWADPAFVARQQQLRQDRMARSVASS